MTTYGDWTEQRVTQDTALGGQPDFTFSAHVFQKGSAQREIGDTIVWLGRRVLVISTKARDFETGMADTLERAESWLHKTIVKAGQQIDGVVRTLKAAHPGEIVLTSERGVQIPWDPTEVEDYFGLIVVNYAAPPDYVPVAETSVPTLVIQAREWQLILQEVRSTSGVFTYIESRLNLDLEQPLGTEREVLGLLGFAEYEGEVVFFPRPFRVPDGTFEEFRQKHPESELGFDDDDRLGFIVDAMISHAHEMDPDLTDIDRVHDYLKVAEVLDSIPRRNRTPIGKRFLEKAESARSENRPRYFVVKAVNGNGRILFMSHPGTRSERREFLKFLTTLLHAKFLTVSDDPDTALTLGVGTEPYPNAGRSHDYCLCIGHLWHEDADFIDKRDALFDEYFSEESA
jgi:hypothetical protein